MSFKLDNIKLEIEKGIQEIISIHSLNSNLIQVDAFCPYASPCRCQNVCYDNCKPTCFTYCFD